MLYIVLLRFHRRQLHVFVPNKSGKRKTYDGTMSMGLKRGSLVRYNRYGICYVGGTSGGRVSLHNMQGKRISQSIDCVFLTYSSCRYWEGIFNKIK